MNARLLLTAVLSAVLGAAGYALYLHFTAPGADSTHAGHAAPAQSDRRILYWYDPMVPQQRFDKPGKSPFMDMDLVPKYADEDSGAGAAASVSVDPRMQQNLGVRLAEVEKTALEGGGNAVGTVRVDETRIRVVQSRVAGFVEQQQVRALNQAVSRGQVLLTLTAPELIATQHELLLALKSGDAALASAARERLRLGGMAERQIGEVERNGQVQERVAIVAPETGIVTELNARPGMTVAAGAPLMTVAALDRVWVVADVPERDAALVSVGRSARLSFAALPGKVLEGKVEYIYPEIAGATRTLQARIALANAKGELKPGMLAQVSFSGGAQEKRLTVPSEAVIETGTRSVVIVADGAGRFAAADVRTGAERGGRTEILSGLEAGQKVVASGQFLIDSEASLSGALARLTAPPPVAAAPAPLAQGKVDAVDAAAGTIKLSHGPVASVGMPGMTMSFKVDPPALLRGIAVGQEVEFDLEKRGTDYVVVKLVPKGAQHRH